MSIAETLGQLALFADLTPSQLEAIAHSHEEDVFAAGERVLRRGLSGGNFYVILEGEASVEIDGESRAKLARGDFFGEISALTGEPPTADVVASTMLRCLVIPGPQLERLLLDRPQLMLRMLRMEARRLRSHARVAAVERPFPPGDYDVVVVGSGPGGLQTSYCLRQLGVRHALLSRDERPGGMFQRFPIFQRLITWTKPDAPVERGSREYEWYDHNSLLAEEPELKALVPGADGPRLRPALARRDGGRPGRLRRARPARGPLRLHVGVDPLRGRAARARDERRRVPLPRGGLRARGDRALARRGSRARARRALRRHARARALRRPRRVRRRQAQLRLRGRAGDPALGALDRARLAAPGADRRARPLGAARPLPAPLRRVRARRPRHLRDRRDDRADRARRRAAARRHARDDLGRRARVRGRRRDRRDRVPDAAAGPAAARARDRRRRAHPGADAVLGERLAAGRLLRRERLAGRARHRQARRRRELELRERLPLQRARARPAPGRAARRPRACARAGGRRRAVPAARADGRARAVGAEGLSLPRRLGGRRLLRGRGRRPARRRSSTPPAPTRSPRPSRSTRAARSCRCSTSAAAASPEHQLEPHPLHEYEGEPYRKHVAAIVS